MLLRVKNMPVVVILSVVQSVAVSGLAAAAKLMTPLSPAGQESGPVRQNQHTLASA